MATRIDRQEINCMASQDSRVSEMSSSSNKSFYSFERSTSSDSLERSSRTPLLHHQTLVPVRNLSSSLDEEGSEEVMGQESSSILQGTQLKFWPPSISRNAVCARYPRGKASLLVFVVNIIVSYAFGAAIVGILDIFLVHTGEPVSAKEERVLQFIQLLFQRWVSRIFYPLAGFIADVYIGRCRMIHTSFFLLFLGYIILVVSYVLDGQSSLQTHDMEMGLKVMRIVSFLFISAGGGAFEATIIPFGVDQLQGASSAEISSYFYFFYFGRNLGIICGIVMYGMVSYSCIALRESENDSEKLANLLSVFQPLVTICILTVGLVLNVCLYHWYFKNTLRENPVKLVAKVLCYAATVKRHLPVHRRAFRYGEERKSRIDLAKVQYDGKFSAEKVEDVKTFCRICLLILALFPAMTSVNAFYTFIGYEANVTLAEVYPGTSFSFSNFYPNAFAVFNAIFVLSSLPVFNFCVVPCFPKLTIRIRIGIGAVFYLIGMAIVIVIHALNRYEQTTIVQLWCLFLPVAVFSIAEALFIVSVLEFIYAQSPESMKGFLTGIFYFVFGLSSFLSSLAFYKYSIRQNHKQLLYYHLAFTVTQVMGVMFYVTVATLHKNRLRPDQESYNQQLLIGNTLN